MTWAKSDKIAAGSMVIALIALFYPIAKDIHSAASKPTAVIQEPPPRRVDGSIEHGVQGSRKIAPGFVQVSGTAEDIPGDHDLWLVLRSEDAGTWQPIGRLQVMPDGRWVVPKERVALRAPGKYGIFVFLTSNRSSSELQQWVFAKQSNPPATQLPSLPVEMTLLAAKTFDPDNPDE